MTMLSFAERHAVEDAAVEVEAGRLCLRMAREVYREYQRSLWDHDFKEGRRERRRAMLKFRHELAEAEALAKLPADQKEKIVQLKADDARKTAEFEAEEMRLGRLPLPEHTATHPSTQVAASDEADHEHQFHKWGDVGLLMLDQRADPYAGGEAPQLGQGRALDDAERPNICEAQWQFILGCLGTGVRALLVSAEAPFIWEDRDKVKSMERKMAKGGVEGDKLHYIQDQWVFRPTVLALLLDRLFAWRDEEEGREVTLLCGSGGLGRGFETTVTDARLNVDMRQLAVGPCTDTLRPFLPSTTGLVRRFQFEHEVAPSHNYGLVEVEVTVEEEMMSETDDEEDVAAEKAAEEQATAAAEAAGVSVNAMALNDEEQKAAAEKAERNKKEARRKKGKGEKRRMVRLETKQAAVTAQLVTPAAADAKHSKGRLRNGPPGWFKKWSPATPSYWWDDDIMLRAEGLPSMRALHK